MDFADALRQRLIAQAELFAALSSNTTIIGTGREQALSDLLREVLPRRLEVLSGVIARLDDGSAGKSARQVDLLIADTHDFPVLARSGSLAVVLPDAVRAVIEIKSRVSGADEMRAAIEQLAEIRAECTPDKNWFSVLFSYNYPNSAEALRAVLDTLLETRNEATRDIELRGAAPHRAIRGQLQEATPPLEPAHLPDLIVSEQGALAIKARKVYRFYRCDPGRAVLVLLSEILTAVTTELVRTGSIGPRLKVALTSAADVHSKFLQANKAQVLDDLPIGEVRDASKADL